MKKILAITVLSSAILVSGSAFAKAQDHRADSCKLTPMIVALSNLTDASINFKAPNNTSLIQTIKKMQKASGGNGNGFSVKEANKGIVLVTAKHRTGQIKTMQCAQSKNIVTCSLQKKR
jgi:hypothetical protein